MPLAECRSAVAMPAQYLSNRGGAFLPEGVVSWIATGEIGNDAKSHAMMVTTGKEGCAGRRAHRRSVEVVVSQSLRSQLVQLRRLHRTAKGARVCKPDVVE